MSIIRRLFAAVCIVACVLVGAPAANAATSEVDLLAFDRIAHGSAVRATVTVTCDPVSPDIFTYFSLTLSQGRYPKHNYIEGFGGLSDPTQQTVTCDGTFQLYSFTVVPTADYAGKRFRPGRAIVEYVVTQCTDPTTGTSVCTSEELVRESVTITP
jgi:hypothetical protein